MKKFTTKTNENPVADPHENHRNFDPITEIVRLGAQRILEQALQQEIDEYLKRFQNHRDLEGHQLVVRNGYLPQRELLTGVGTVPVKQPRVRDKREVKDQTKFVSKILPPYLRKTKNIEEFLPWLYLKGISTGDMEQTLRTLLGENAKGLSSTVISRLKEDWKEEYETWNERSFEGKQYMYVFAESVAGRAAGSRLRGRL